MDKENKDQNENFDDILKLLKDEFENSDSSDINEEINEEINDIPLDDESVKEMLRERFSIGVFGEQVEASSEYAIDESFTLDAQQDEPDNTEESKIKEEPLEDTFAPEEEIALPSEAELDEEIPEEMPEVSAIPDETPEFHGVEISPEYIAMLENLASKEEEYEDTADDDSDFDPSRNETFLFVEKLEEDMPEEDVEENTEVSYAADPEVEVDSYEEKTEKAVCDEPCEDDLPWYEDEQSVDVDSSYSPVVEADKYEEVVLEEYVEEPEAKEGEPTDDTEDIADFDTGYTAEELSIDYSEDDVDEPLVLTVSEESELTPEEKKEITEAEMAEIDEESFYRTMMDAERASMAKFAVQRELDDVMVDDSFDDSNEDGEYDFDGTELEDILHVSEAISDGDESLGAVEKSKFEEKYGISTDFFAATALDRESDTSEDISEAFATEMELDADEEDFEQHIGKVSMWGRLKPIALGALTLMLLILELLPVFEVVPGGILDYTEYGVIYVLFDIQLITLVTLLYWRKLLDGFTRLIMLSVNVYSVLAMTLLLTFIHSIVSCFMAPHGMPYLYNSISALYIFAVYMVDIFDAKRVRRAVSELMMADEVYTLKRSHGKDSIADKMYLGGVAPDTNIYEPASIKNGEYRRAFVNSREDTNDKTVIYAMTPVVVFSALIAVSSMVLGNEFSYAINAMVVTFTTLAPLSAIVSSFLTLFVSNSRLRYRGCVIASEKAAYRIGDCDALVFGDRHLYKESNAKDNGIKFYNEHRAHEVLTYLDAVYGAIGGPMQTVFSGANKNAPRKKAAFVRITRNGVEAIVDGKVSVIIGSEEYLLRYGISVGEKTSEIGKGIMYVAINSRLEAKLSLNYRTEPLFESLSELMGDNKITTVIETYDPVISSAYVAYCRRARAPKYPISVVHKNKTDYYKTDKAEMSASKAGAYVISSRLKLVELAIFAKKTVKLIRFNKIIRSAFFGIAALFNVIFTVSGAMQDVNTLWVLLYHLLMGGVYLLATLYLLPVAFDKMKTEE